MILSLSIVKDTYDGNIPYTYALLNSNYLTLHSTYSSLDLNSIGIAQG